MKLANITVQAEIVGYTVLEDVTSIHVQFTFGNDESHIVEYEIPSKAHNKVRETLEFGFATKTLEITSP